MAEARTKPVGSSEPLLGQPCRTAIREGQLFLCVSLILKKIIITDLFLMPDQEALNDPKALD